MQAILCIADGFEDAEAILVVDMFRRLKLDIKLVSATSSLTVHSYWGVDMQADMLLSDLPEDKLYDAVIVAGGPANTVTLGKHSALVSLLRRHDEAGKLVCALCSAPARVLAANGLLRGRHYVCSSGLEKDITDGIFTDAPVVRDGNLITGKGLGVATDFALNIAAVLTGDKAASAFQAGHIYAPSYYELP